MGGSCWVMLDDPAVGVVVDGMYLGTNVASLVDLFDVEAVEVLRGPQGTLFGRNVTGGAVLVRHRRPTGEFSIRGKTTAGTYEWVEQNLVVEAPVSDKLAWKIGMSYRDKGGYYDNTVRASSDLGDERTWLLRPMLTWKPTANLEVTLITEFSDFEGDGVPNRLIKDRRSTNNPSSSSKKFTTDMMPEVDYHSEQAVLDINWDIGPGKLTSITGYRQYKAPAEIDADSQDSAIFHGSLTSQQDQFSEELRYATTMNERVELTTGITFFTQNLIYDEERTILNGAIKRAANSIMDHYSVGFFAQGDLDLTDTLTLTLGGRYTWEEKDVKVASLGGTRTADLKGFSYDFIDNDRWDFFSWHGCFNWHATENFLLYTSLTRSFRSGGYNMRNQLPASPGPYGKERVDALESGIKASWFNGRIRTRLAGFFNDFKDLQRTVIGPSIEQEILNAADATITGFEVEMTVLPFKNFQMDFSLGYTDASYDRFDGFDIDGDKIPDPDEAEDLKFLNVPEWSAYLGGTYYTPMPWKNEDALELKASASYTDGYPITTNNVLTQDSYTLVDASISYLFFKEHIKFSIFGQNLLDEHYSHFGVNSSLFDYAAYTQVGAIGGIELRFEF
ncbi:MAG: TonB-dependent receptor, partial [FCB group bacterium]|nr:TonB-dependent receptor [FCB group bacterium]